MAVTMITGDLATDTINQTNRVPDVDPDIALLEPNVAPLTLLTSKLRRRTAYAPKVEWLEDESAPRFDTTSASATSAAGTIGVSNGNYFRVGDFIRDTTTGEGMEVTATASGSLTVTRGIGGVTAAAVGSGDELFIVGNVNAEGAGLREIKIPKLVNQYNYTEIVRTPFGVTGTEAATKLFGGPDITRLEAKFAVEHMRLLEQIALVGARKEDTTTAGKPKRFAGGAYEYITTNVTGGVGTLTETTWLTFLRSGFRYGSGRKLLLAAPLVVNAMEGYARANIKTSGTADHANTYGIQMSEYVSGQGIVDIVMERWMNDSAIYRGYAFLIDLDSVFYCPLRDTKLLRDRQSPDLDKMEHEYLTEATFVFKHERRHALLKGVTG